MIYAIIPSRGGTASKTLSSLRDYIGSGQTMVIYDAASIYDAVNRGIAQFNIDSGGLKDEDIIVICHDDIEILSTYETFSGWLQVCLKPGVGYIGVAGACRLNQDGVWWNSRMNGAARGFVFQGISHQRMTPNHFGPAGQTVVMDGCFLAVSYKTLKTLGFEQPHYISTGWDFYDIHTTFTAHLKGYNNYVVPILIRHESIGQMRDGWYQAKEQFVKYHARDLPCTLNVEKTHGIPGL
jgi:hypothetical protein